MALRLPGWLSHLVSSFGDDSHSPESRPPATDPVPAELLEPIDLHWEVHSDGVPGAPLPLAICDEVKRLGNEANARMDEGRYVEAIALFRRGIEILPRPRHRWPEAEWFLAGIGDALWFLGLHLNAVPVWRDILLLNGLGNPFVHLRRGQTLYELGNHGEAANELMRALLLGGEPLFEEEPRKYWDFITARARPPKGRTSWEGWTGVEPGDPLHQWLMDPGQYDLRAPARN
jgi:tetratricopeptide (TPR) repeat protein